MGNDKKIKETDDMLKSILFHNNTNLSAHVRILLIEKAASLNKKKGKTTTLYFVYKRTKKIYAKYIKAYNENKIDEQISLFNKYFLEIELFYDIFEDIEFLSYSDTLARSMITVTKRALVDILFKNSELSKNIIVNLNLLEHPAASGDIYESIEKRLDKSISPDNKELIKKLKGCE